MLFLRFFLEDFPHDFVVKRRVFGADFDSFGAVLSLNLELGVGFWRGPSGQSTLDESVLMVLNGVYVELSNQVCLQLLLGVVEDQGGYLELVYLEELQGLGVAGYIYPRVEHWGGGHLSAAIEFSQALYVLLKVFTLIVDKHVCWEHTDCAALVVAEAPLFKLLQSSYFAKIPLDLILLDGILVLHVQVVVFFAGLGGNRFKQLVVFQVCLDMALFDVALLELGV